MNTAGWVLIGCGLALMALGAVVEVRRRPAEIRPVSKNPIAELIDAIAGVLKALTGMFKILKDYTTGRFLMALGLVLVVLGVIVGLAS